MIRWRAASVAAAIVLALTAGCAATPKPSLFVALGGQPGIEHLVDATLVEVRGDARIQELFAETDFDYLRARLVEHLCVVADGPCEYQGLPMTDAHSGMDISEREFNWFVEDFERGMRKAGVPLATQNRLLARLARLRAEIIRQ